jgi:hypothetical protein
MYMGSAGIAPLFSHGATAPVDQGLLVIEGTQSHSDTPLDEDQPVAETST